MERKLRVSSLGFLLPPRSEVFVAKRGSISSWRLFFVVPVVVVAAGILIPFQMLMDDLMDPHTGLRKKKRENIHSKNGKGDQVEYFPRTTGPGENAYTDKKNVLSFGVYLPFKL